MNQFDHTDIGNAKRFEHYFRDQLRFNTQLGWLRWDGKVLRAVNLPWQEAMELPTHIRSELTPNSNPEHVEALESWAYKSSAGPKLAQAVRMCEDPGNTLYVALDELDAQPWMLNTPSGLVDLRASAPYPAEITDHVRKITKAPLDMGMETPVFDKFLERVLPDHEVRVYVQKMCGYAITGLTVQEEMFILHGTGQNGKTKFLEAIAYALGDYATTVNSKTLTVQKWEGHPTEIAKLAGARFAHISELEKNAKLDEAKFKALTGGDTLTGRFMREDFFDFPATHTFVMATNDLPQVSSTGNALWRRLVVVPFTVTIPDSERDNGLLDKLKDEGPGILAWCVAGAHLYHDEGLKQPTEVALATLRYRSEQDTAAKFVGECLTRNESARTQLVAIQQAYKRWCGIKELSPGNQSELTTALRGAGIESKSDGSKRGWTAEIDASVYTEGSWV